MHLTQYITEVPQVSTSNHLHNWGLQIFTLITFIGAEHIFINFLLFIGALIVYDITDADSFNQVQKWVMELKKYLPTDTPLIIAGNKYDIQDKLFPLEDAEK